MGCSDCFGLSGGTLAAPSRIPTWMKPIRMTHADLAQAATTRSIILYTPGARVTVEGVAMKHAAAFTGGTITEYYLSVGTADDPELFVPETNVFSAPANTLFKLDNALEIFNWAGAVDMLLTARCVGDTLDHAAAGAVDVWLKLAKLPLT